MVLRMKNLNIWGFTEKSDFKGGGFRKTNVEGRIALKVGGLGQFVDLRGAWQEGVMVFRGER